MMSFINTCFLLICAITLVLSTKYFVNAEYPTEVLCINYTSPQSMGTATKPKPKPTRICYTEDVNAASSLNPDNFPPIEMYDIKTYTIYTNTTKENKIRNLTGDDTIFMTIEIKRSGYQKYLSDNFTVKDLTTSKYIKVNTIGQCKSHKFCGDDKYSADCTNIRFGRNVTCEPRDPFFFPFTTEILTSGLPLQKLPLLPPNPKVRCHTFKIPNGTTTKSKPPFQVCATSDFKRFNNTTQVQVGHYTIYGSDKRQPVYTYNFNSTGKRFRINNIGSCSNFKSCGNNKFSVDCSTVIKFGRNVTCEPIEPIFFPFTSDAVTLPSSKAFILPTD